MIVLRRHLLQRRFVALGLVALALLLKLVVPTGYMIGTENGALTIELCSGAGPMKMAMPMAGMVHGSDHKDDHAKADMPCAFAGLTLPSLAAADPLLLAAAIGFIIRTVFRTSAHAAPGRVPPYLRPPLRGPPAAA